MNLTEAEKLASEAYKVRRHIEQQIEYAKCEVKNRYQKLINAECVAIDNTHAAILQDAIAHERETARVRDELKVASMKDATLGGVPVGGRVCKWEPKYRFSSNMKKTDEVGVIEVCTADSGFPSNQNYSLPSVGQLFIRILKKDGKPSLRFVCGWTFDGGLPYGWYPEGVEPK